MDFVIDRDVMVPMRDGVNLSTDIYRPHGQAVPALLHRFAYGKHRWPQVSTIMVNPVTAMEHGYAVVVQDVRGTGCSEGLFDPIFQERADGHDAIRWIAGQPWCSGEVGIYGSSYQGHAAIQACVDSPSPLKAACAYIAGANFFESGVYSGGVFEMGSRLPWTLNDAEVQSRRTPDPDLAESVSTVLQAYRGDLNSYMLSTFDVYALTGECDHLVPYFRRFLDHRSYDEYWARADVVAAANRVHLPVMTIAAWHDTFLKAGLDLHHALTRKGSEELRKAHSLIVGPWDHKAYTSMRGLTSAGERDFGATAVGGQPGLEPTVLNWFDRWLKGRSRTTTPVRYFHMGPDIWTTSQVWPPAGTKEERWYLHSDGEAEQGEGGELNFERPTQPEPFDSYVYDPSDPAPTLGGRHLVPSAPSGVQDQRELQVRPDVLSYTSSDLPASRTVSGRVTVEMYAQSSASTTDFVAVLVDVHPDGYAENVADGIIRLPAIEGDGQEPTSFTIDLWQTAYTFPAGHRIRLLVTSSSFPRFERNRNLPATEPPNRATCATQRIFHSCDYSSALVLEISA